MDFDKEELDKCIISVAGSHASETLDSIFERKKKDISSNGSTYWVANIRKKDRDLISNDKNLKVIFVKGASKNSTKNTKKSCVATHSSIDGNTWKELLNSLSPVTGNVNNRKQITLKLKELETIDSMEIDLNDYENLKFSNNCSTCLAERKKNNSKNNPNSRRVLAIGTLEGLEYVKKIER